MTASLALVVLICLGDFLTKSGAISKFHIEEDNGLLGVNDRAGVNAQEFSGDSSQETSRISLLTPYGPIKISLMSENAPLMTKVLFEESKKRLRSCNGCTFYRAEARATQGPPYALLQGSFADDLDVPETKEGSRSIKAGDVVAMLPTKDFYIALQDHPDWSSAHTVVGTVDDFVAIDLIGVQKIFKRVHPKFSTEMRMLKEPVEFVMTDDMSEMVMPKYTRKSDSTRQDQGLLHTKAPPSENDYEYEYEYEYVDLPEDGEKDDVVPQHRQNPNQRVKAPDMLEKHRKNKVTQASEDDIIDDEKIVNDLGVRKEPWMRPGGTTGMKVNRENPNQRVKAPDMLEKHRKKKATQNST